MSGAPLRSLGPLILTLFLFAGCDEEPFEPIQQSDLAFSIYGFLDASADTQWVRVTSVRTSLFTSPDLPDATVTLEHLGTGEVTTLHDSVFVYPGHDPDVGGDLFARNFWTNIPMEQGATYRLTATRSDGVSSTVSAVVPEDADTVVAGILQGRRVATGGTPPPVYRDYLRLVGPEYLAVVQVVPACAPMEFVHVAGGPDARADENGELRIDVQRTLACPDPFGRPPHPIRAWDLRIALSGSLWPFDPEWTHETAFLPDVASIVESGLGFLGGVLTREVPYETCYVIGATYGEYCELPYTDRPTAVEGVVRERVQTPGGCEPVPSEGVTIFLWENDRPDTERSAEVEAIHGATLFLQKPDGVKVRTAFTKPNGTYRIGALVPGRNYGVSVSLHDVLYPQDDGVTVESGETLERDLELPGECG